MHLKHKLRTVLLLGSGILSAFFLSACSPKSAEYSKTGTYFDTVIQITLYDKEKVSCMDDCFEMADHYEKLLSRTIKTSDVSKINEAGGHYVTVDEDTLELIRKGLYYCKLSKGKFDITVGALSDLWDITNNPGIVPDKKDIQAAQKTINYQNVKIRGNQVALKKKDACLDLGGIAKGYIADKMKAYLKSQGVTSAMINLGGNVLTIGNKPDGSTYTVGIQKPFDEMNRALGALSISDQTVVSSGIYERYFKVDDKIYHHLLDTSTGYPIENNLLGVTIICNDSVDGDGLSTTCFALGLDQGMKLIESLSNTEAIFITNDYKLHLSSGIGSMIPFQEQ